MPAPTPATPAQALALGTFVKLRRAANTLSARLNSPMLRDHELTESQLGVLEALFHLGPMPQNVLCGKLLVSGSNLVTVIDNLERRGAVRRQRDAADRRVQIIHLTPAGRVIIARAFRRHAENIRTLMAALTPAEQRQLGRLCRKLGRAAADQELA